MRDYQLAKLASAKAPYPTLAPQAMLAATEQGWTTNTDADTCEPHQHNWSDAALQAHQLLVPPRTTFHAALTFNIHDVECLQSSVTPCMLLCIAQTCLRCMYLCHAWQRESSSLGGHNVL